MFELDDDFDFDDDFLQNAFTSDVNTLPLHGVKRSSSSKTENCEANDASTKKYKVDVMQIADKAAHTPLQPCLQSLDNYGKVPNTRKHEQFLLNKEVSKDPSHQTQRQEDLLSRSSGSYLARKSSSTATIMSSSDQMEDTFFSRKDCDSRNIGKPVDRCLLNNNRLINSSLQSINMSPSHKLHTQSKTIVENQHKPSTSKYGNCGVSAVKVIRQRKFPGPAGLLPEQDSGFSSGSSSTENRISCGLEEPLCSQSSNSIFEEPAWLQLLTDLDIDRDETLRTYTVAWVKRKAAAKQLAGQKVPFLAAALKSIDCSSPDPCVVLQDKTGEIHGTLHREVWEDYGGQLQPGSVLVLRQVGVLSTGTAARRHYLNITTKNVTTIYSNVEENLAGNSNLSQICKDVHITRVQLVSKHELLNSIYESKLNALNNNSPRNVAESSSLYTTVCRNQTPVSMERQPQIATPSTPNLVGISSRISSPATPSSQLQFPGIPRSTSTPVKPRSSVFTPKTASAPRGGTQPHSGVGNSGSPHHDHSSLSNHRLSSSGCNLLQDKVQFTGRVRGFGANSHKVPEAGASSQASSVSDIFCSNEKNPTTNVSPKAHSLLSMERTSSNQKCKNVISVQNDDGFRPNTITSADSFLSSEINSSREKRNQCSNKTTANIQADQDLTMDESLMISSMLEGIDTMELFTGF